METILEQSQPKEKEYSEKKAYVEPTLRVFGDVACLTLDEGTGGEGDFTNSAAWF